MMKYQKELEYILNYYQQEEKKRRILKERAIKTISKNTEIMKKIQKINEEKIREEIERRNKCREYNNRENKIKLCNQM